MKRIIDLSYKHHLSHVGSCTTTYPILKAIYREKHEDDIVILSCGHAGLAQYVAIEQHGGGGVAADADQMLLDMGTHPSRDLARGIHVSSGSLGSACLIAVGYAIARRDATIYCILSDGECAEGSVWEAFALCYKMNLKNLRFHVNINGFSAYDSVDRAYLEKRLLVFCPWITVHQTNNPAFLEDGCAAHYNAIREMPADATAVITPRLPETPPLPPQPPMPPQPPQTYVSASAAPTPLRCMRAMFAAFLLEEMSKNDKIYIITADIGYGVLDNIRAAFPTRFLNVGSCENLMIGIAIGLYYSGFLPICYTITPFLLYRPFEMIRNYINHEKIPVKLVGSGRDHDYTRDGFTHWSEDDERIVSGAFTNISIYKPDIISADFLHEIIYNDNPCYLNLIRG